MMNSYAVIYEFVAGKYTAIQLDRKIEERSYSRIVVDGSKYPIVPTYDMGTCIGIEAQGGFVGKSVELK